MEQDDRDMSKIMPGEGEIYALDATDVSFGASPAVTEEQVQARMQEYVETWDRGDQLNLYVKWHTPPEYLEAVREVMGGIDIDPASSDLAQRRVKARTYFTLKQDGLKAAWYGRLMLNPNYSDEEKWFDKAISEYRSRHVTEAVIITHTMKTWELYFSRLAEAASSLCLVRGRIHWIADHAVDVGASRRCGIDFDPQYNRHGSVVFYMGENNGLFRRVFSRFGVCYGRK